VRRWYAASVAAAVFIGVAVGVVLHGRLAASNAGAERLAVPALHGEATWARGERPAPQFALRDQKGRVVRLEDLRGRPVALLFMDSLCREACPLEGRSIAAALRAVPQRARPTLLVVSVDPAGDTPRTIAKAGRKWGLPVGFEWLLGTRAQLARVWRAYDITVEASSGDVVHSTAVYVLDRSGFERAGFLMPFIPGLVAQDLRVLDREVSGRVRPTG
jgi:protein SCO1